MEYFEPAFVKTDIDPIKLNLCTWDSCGESRSDKSAALIDVIKHLCSQFKQE